MNIHLHTICYNERDLMEIAIKYWQSSVDHVFVYLMNSSNDGSKEFLSKYRNYISVINIKDDNEFNDARNIYIKNNCWKASRGKADFVIVTDFDEFIYAKDIFKELEYMKKNGMTIVAPEVYHLMSKDNIINELNNEKYLHEQVTTGFYEPKFGKYCIFDPNAIEEIRNAKTITADKTMLSECSSLTTIKITGSGTMTDCTSGNQPWNSVIDKITTVI